MQMNSIGQAPFHLAQGRLYADRGYFDLALLEFELARKIASRSASSQSSLDAISEAINETKKLLTLPGPEYLVLRRAEELDAEQIHLAHMKSINEICSRDHSEEEIRVWGGRKFDPNFRIPAINEQFYVVVECEGRIEGFCQLKTNDKTREGSALLSGLYITPKMLNQKVGAYLLNLVFSYCRYLNIHEVTLRSSFTAVEFYKKHGFTQAGEMVKTIREGVGIRGFPMVWKW